MSSFARQLRKSQSKAERLLWYLLRDRRLSGIKFRRQHPLGPYIVDFCCISKKLIVELDGGHHALQVYSDAQRTKYLNSEGYKVIRFWNNEVLGNPEVVLDVIYQELNKPIS